MLILIADDMASIRELVAATVVGEGDTILDAADGNAAWALLQQHTPDVAILDVSMPGRNGLELTRAIRADARLAAIPVILLTAHAHPEDIQAGLAAGADLYLTKPFSPLALLDALDQLRAGGAKPVTTPPGLALRQGQLPPQP